MIKNGADCVFVGVVTVLYNSDDVLPDFFHSLYMQNGTKFKLYVIDNSPGTSGSDLSRKLSAKYSLDSMVIFNNANLGVAAGNNMGIKLALKDNCTHILLANNDTAFGVDVIDSLVRRLKLNNADAIAPKIYYHNSKKIWYAGGDISKWLGISSHWRHGKIDGVPLLKPDVEVSYAPTCFMLLKYEIFQLIGLMDEKYFCYWDDTDFVFRMSQATCKLYYTEYSSISHKVSFSTGGDFSPFSIYHLNRNRIYFIRKNFHGIYKLSSLAYAIITRIIRCFQLPSKLRTVMCKGLLDGFQMKI